MGWLQRLLGRKDGPETTGSGGAAVHPEAAADAEATRHADTPTVAADPLTGLGDRLRLHEHLQQLVDSSPASGDRPALLLLDVDHLGSINDDFGPATGDQVLRHIAGRLLGAAGGTGVYRAGGDRFAILVEAATVDSAAEAAEALRSMVTAAVDAYGTEVAVTASIAVVMLGDRLSADAVLRDADVTLFKAKSLGGDRFEVYTHETDDWSFNRKRDVETLLREVEELRLENQMLSEAMLVDPTSGLPNGAAFDADLQQLHARRTRQSDPFTVLIAELDEFDDYCETHGRPGRQAALRAVAESIHDSVRQTDRAYRYGPHEFAVLLPGCDSRQGVAAAERLRQRVERMAIDHHSRPSGLLTVSVGVAEAGFRHSNAKDVIKEIGELIAAAKASGGNRVVWPH